MQKLEFLHWRSFKYAMFLFCIDLRYHPWYWLSLFIMLAILSFYTGLYYYLFVVPLVIVAALFKTLYLKDTRRHCAINRLIRQRFNQQLDAKG